MHTEILRQPQRQEIAFKVIRAFICATWPLRCFHRLAWVTDRREVQQRTECWTSFTELNWVQISPRSLFPLKAMLLPTSQAPSLPSHCPTLCPQLPCPGGFVFMYSFTKHWLSAYCMPGTVLATVGLWRTRERSLPSYSLVEEDRP